MNNPFVARLLSHSRSWASCTRIALARATGAEIGPGCSLRAGCDVQLGVARAREGRVVLGVGCTLERGVILHPYGGTVILGRSVFLGPGTVVYGHGGVTIGDDSLISMHCRILSSNHAMPPPDTLIRSQPDILLPTKIGRDVWLGAGVTVLGGVTVGDGCIVGAGAVVTKNLSPGCIAMGIPAQIAGMRDDTHRAVD